MRQGKGIYLLIVTQSGRPESRYVKRFQLGWIPVFTGGAIFYERFNRYPKITPGMSRCGLPKLFEIQVLGHFVGAKVTGPTVSVLRRDNSAI